MAGVHAMMIAGSGIVYDGFLYLKPNGITIAAVSNAPKGKWHSFGDKVYYVAIDYADLFSVASVYKRLSGSGEVLANLTRDGQTKTIPLNRVVTTFVEQFSKGTDASALFNGAITFNQSMDSWDTSNVTYMWGMFAHSPVFNQDVSGWDTSNVTDMYGMFSYCRAFVQDISDWCVFKIPSMPTFFDNQTNAKWTDEMKPNWGVPC